MSLLPGRPVFDGLPPGLAGDLAYALFCRPDLSDRRAADHEALVLRARRQLRGLAPHYIDSPVGPVATYTLEPPKPPGTALLIVHGWTSEASFMTAIAEPLRQRGHRVVLLDMPAHGRSPQRRASLIDCARGIRAVAETLGPFDGLLAHSIGALAGLLVAEGGPPLGPGPTFPHVALIAAPNALSEITRSFGAGAGLDDDQQRAFEMRVARVGARPVSRFSSANLIGEAKPRTLVVHSRDDTVIPVANAIEIAQAVPRGQLTLVDDLGHARILYAPPVVRQIRNFFDPLIGRHSDG